MVSSEAIANALDGLSLDSQHFAPKANPSTSISEASDASVIMAIVGLPAPLGATPSPAMPVGERTIAQPRFHVNAGQLDWLVGFLDTLCLRSTGLSEKVWRLWGNRLNGF